MSYFVFREQDSGKKTPYFGFREKVALHWVKAAKCPTLGLGSKMPYFPFREQDVLL
jgi:hypothetical protein